MEEVEAELLGEEAQERKMRLQSDAIYDEDEIAVGQG
jgi:hypothetical protein